MIYVPSIMSLSHPHHAVCDRRREPLDIHESKWKWPDKLEKSCLASSKEPFQLAERAHEAFIYIRVAPTDSLILHQTRWHRLLFPIMPPYSVSTARQVVLSNWNMNDHHHHHREVYFCFKLQFYILILMDLHIWPGKQVRLGSWKVLRG